jgi:chorismate dehydratase
MSVKLFSRVPAERIQTLALDEGSRTSAALVRILLMEKYGTSPRLEPLPIGATLGDTRADAVLLIGDRAIQSPAGRFAEVWDLGDEWVRWTGLPFVFAMWVAREGRTLIGVEQALRGARDRGVTNLAAIAQQEAAAKGLTVPQCLSYLRDNLHFYLGPREQEGLAKFRDYANDLGICKATFALGWHAQSAVMGVE